MPNFLKLFYNDCFMYFFTAAMHLKYAFVRFNGSSSSGQPKGNPDNYSSSSPLAHYAIGGFQVPMGLKQMKKNRRTKQWPNHRFQLLSEFFLERKLMLIRQLSETIDGFIIYEHESSLFENSPQTNCFTGLTERLWYQQRSR